ncbi:hypothetical protein PLICRDRAFT_40863 [Plicaturopsis crispa FD-325 SS-3]|nr:hypothetical protein PLICRDRAFT_40863 [Plicaturopsis crispa FD-325 SS-3]
MRPLNHLSNVLWTRITVLLLAVALIAHMCAVAPSSLSKLWATAPAPLPCIRGKGDRRSQMSIESRCLICVRSSHMF